MLLMLKTESEFITKNLLRFLVFFFFSDVIDGVKSNSKKNMSKSSSYLEKLFLDILTLLHFQVEKRSEQQDIIFC